VFYTQIRNNKELVSVITSIDSELEKEIQAMRAEHELLEDTPFDFFDSVENRH